MVEAGTTVEAVEANATALIQMSSAGSTNDSKPAMGATNEFYAAVIAVVTVVAYALYKPS
jgi:hypothetical protein